LSGQSNNQYTAQINNYHNYEIIILNIYDADFGSYVNKEQAASSNALYHHYSSKVEQQINKEWIMKQEGQKGPRSLT